MDKRLHEHAADLKTLALELGLSQSTVSRALRAHPGIPESTRRRVVAAAEAAGYRPNARARSLATGRTETIGLSFPLERLQLPETNFVDVLAGISTAVTSRNYNLLLSPFEGDEFYVSVPDGRGFAARCPIDIGNLLEEPCRVTFQHRGMDVNIRFPRAIIADWAVMLGGVRRTLDGLIR